MTHKHSYYCRRCAQLYRALHRKKTDVQQRAVQASLKRLSDSGAATYRPSAADD